VVVGDGDECVVVCVLAPDECVVVCDVVLVFEVVAVWCVVDDLCVEACLVVGLAFAFAFVAAVLVVVALGWAVVTGAAVVWGVLVVLVEDPHAASSNASPTAAMEEFLSPLVGIFPPWSTCLNDEDAPRARTFPRIILAPCISGSSHHRSRGY
jgi:hypothetical protein